MGPANSTTLPGAHNGRRPVRRLDGLRRASRLDQSPRTEHKNGIAKSRPRQGYRRDVSWAPRSARGGNSWTCPSNEEYPGGRQWNQNAAQFVYPPAALEPDQTPHHPHWDKICDHIGAELTPVLRELGWTKKANIKRGGDYIRAWIACAFREPFEQLPYLFLWGSQEAGKSTLHEALALLVTKGVVKADKALTSNNEFNGELAGAIICAVEEKNIALTPGAYARIKELTTARTVAIRQMRRDVYQVPNTTHWIQTSNQQSACPVDAGDTRITVIQVGDLLKEQQIPKKTMEERLREEAPHFMYTLLNMTLPPCIDRLRLPVVETASKAKLVRKNAPVASFVRERCEMRPLICEGLTRLYEAHVEWASANGFQVCDKKKFADELFQVTEGRIFDNGRRIMLGGKKAHVLEGVRLKEVLHVA